MLFRSDMDMVSEGFIGTIKKSIAEGKIDMETLDKACRRILEAKYKLGLFDNPYKYCDLKRPKRDIFTKEHRDVARKIWIGNIEIHERSSDWFKHGHHADAGYNSVILHIASEIDTEISRSNGERIPQIQLICPEAVRTNYKELLETDDIPLR